MQQPSKYGHIRLQSSGCTFSFSMACGLGGGAEVDDDVRGGRVRGLVHILAK
jgi:hypothetical protein